jgi:hypothetical protein
LLLLLIAALAGVWAGIIKPAIKDAAAEEVDKKVPAVIVPPTSVVPTGPTVTVAGPTDSTPVTTVAPVAPVEQGTLFSRLLAPAAPASQTAAVTVDVPAGTNFQLTDFAVQNPNNDAGVAVVMNGTNEIYRLTMSDIQGDKRVSLVTPIEVVGGTSLVFQVTCIGPGAGDSSGNCSTTMLVSGRMVPATPTAPSG